MKRRSTIIILCILLVGVTLLGVFLSNTLRLRLRKALNPLPEEYVSVITEYSKLYSVPIEIVCGVINTESSFNPSALSHAGAIGMMQITESAFDWLQFKSGEEHLTEELYDYKTNIKFGVMFLSILYEEFQNWDTVFAAYNAGRGRVNGWLSNPEYSQNGVLTNIPIEETANYVTKVNKSAKEYKELYFSDAETE